MRFLERFTEPLYAIFRIVFGMLFFSHGAQKVFGLVLYCFAFLYMAARGSGIWSVDAVRGTAAVRR